MSAATIIDEPWPGELVATEVGGTPVLAVNLDGELHAFEDRCLHQRVALSRGRLDGSVLTCAAHGWQYDLRTGCGVNPLGVRLRRFAIARAAGRVVITREDDGARDAG